MFQVLWARFTLLQFDNIKSTITLSVATQNNDGFLCHFFFLFISLLILPWKWKAKGKKSGSKIVNTKQSDEGIRSDWIVHKFIQKMGKKEAEDKLIKQM